MKTTDLKTVHRNLMSLKTTKANEEGRMGGWDAVGMLVDPCYLSAGYIILKVAMFASSFIQHDFMNIHLLTGRKFSLQLSFVQFPP